MRGQLGPYGHAVKWVTPANYHFTLRFLGDLTPDRVEQVAAATTDVARRHAPFTLQLAAPGAFPSAVRPRVLWVGVAPAPGQALVALASELTQRLDATGFTPEERPFSPHLTVGRVRVPPGLTPEGVRRLGEALAELAAQVAGANAAAVVAEVVVMASRLRPEGPEYTPIRRCPFGGA